MSKKRDSERLREAQELRREKEEEARESAPDPSERRAHDRRAQKAAYLRDKLDEQAESPDR